MNTVIKFAKVHPDAKIPSKRDEDMGFDIYACFDEDYIMIYPHETRLIPTGIASACDSDYGIVLKERGSTGSKGIAIRCGIIDSGFRNEWFVCLTNTTDTILFISKLSEDDLSRKTVDYWCYEDPLIYPYEKAIAQALVIPVPKVKVEEIGYEELKDIPSERGMGQLGSSNK